MVVFWVWFSGLSCIPLGILISITYLSGSWLFWVLIAVAVGMSIVYASCMDRLLRPWDYQPYRGKVVYD